MENVLLFAAGIGFVAGLRSFTAPAVVAWAAHSGYISLGQSRLAFIGTTAAAVVVSLLALGELIADKLPKTPKRTALMPLIVRIASGAFCGACLSQTVPALLLGGIGALIGTFAGYQVRKRLVTSVGVKDFVVAIGEDVVAIVLACCLTFW
jgi:uncharacterized membrane protein